MPVNIDPDSATFSERRTFWQGAIQDWEKSGLKQQEFCTQRNIAYSTFQYWRGLLKQQSSTKSIRFTALPVRQQISSQQPAAQPDLQLQIKTQNVSINVFSNTSPNILIAALKALGLSTC